MTIKKFLALAKMRQSAMAYRCGVSRAAVSKWINGERLPSRGSIKKIERVTDGAVTSRDFQ